MGPVAITSRPQALRNRVESAVEAVVFRPEEGIQYVDRVEIYPIHFAGGTETSRIGVNGGGGESFYFENTTAGRLAAVEKAIALVNQGRENPGLHIAGE